MRGVQAVIRIIDGITEHSGRCVAWLTLVMMIVTCTVVVLRYGVGIGSIAMQESVTYLHGMVFMIAIAYAMKHDAHVRVDIVYARLSEANRDWINLVGHLLFLLPVCGYILFNSFGYVVRSWQIMEGSPEVGGIPAVFVLKSLIPLMAVLLALQGIAEILRILSRRFERS